MGITQGSDMSISEKVIRKNLLPCPFCGRAPQLVPRVLLQQEGSGAQKRLDPVHAMYVKCCGSEYHLETWQTRV